MLPSSNLNAKITTLVAMITLVVLTLGFLFVLRFESSRSMEQMKRQATVLGEAIQRVVIESLQNAPDPDRRLQKRGKPGDASLQSLIRDLARIEGIDHIEVVDAAGVLLAHSDRAAGKDPEDDRLIARAIETGKAIEVDERKKHRYERFIPISIRNGLAEKRAAVVEVVFDTQKAATSIQDFRLRGLSATIGITILLSTLLAFFLQKAVTRRIFRLAEMAHQVSRGNFQAAVHDEVPDEIGRLGRIFNLMAGKLEKARSILEKELEAQKEADRLKDNFLAMVSHELRTPLTAVIGFSNAILEGYAGGITAKQRDLIQEIQEKGEHLSLLINNLLDLEKIQGGQMEIYLEEASLDQIIGRSLSMVQIQAKKKGVELMKTLPDELPSLRIDVMKVQSVVTNLLDNAVKFTPAGGRVEISVQYAPLRESRQTYVEIAVSDTGVGIPSSEQDKIFDRFYQTQGGATRSFPGTGLGLALAREFALSHGGWLKLRERPGWSATFSFGLPLNASDPTRVLHLQKTVVHLPSMIQGVIHLLKDEGGSVPGIEFTPPQEKEIEEVVADRAYLRGMLIHILQNALRYRTKETVVQIKIDPAEDMTQIAIENQGPPFSGEEMKKICAGKGGDQESGFLAPYSRVHSLRAAHEILRAHGGKLKIENYTEETTEGDRSGARFLIQLPRLKAPLTLTGDKKNGQEKNSDRRR